MALGVAGGGDDLHLAPGEIVRFAARNPDVDARDLVRFRLGTDDLGMPFLLEGEIAFDMVGMVMGGEDVGQFPALGRELALDGGSLGRIDGGGEARGPVMDQDTVIVLAADEMMEIQL